jgi:hypothetical protein
MRTTLSSALASELRVAALGAPHAKGHEKKTDGSGMPVGEGRNRRMGSAV